MTIHAPGRLAALTLLALVACDADSGPSELDRARVLAVRVSPAHLAPDQVASIDVLVGSDDGRVAEVAPTSVSLAVAGPPLDGMISRADQGWQVACPPEQALAELRGAFEIDEGDPIPVQLEVDVEVDGEPLDATKVVVLGSASDDPALAGIDVSGADTDDDRTLVLGAGDLVGIAADGATGETELSYAWYSSVGEIDLYESEAATLTAAGPKTGQLVLVVRDQLGGVTWSWLDVRVE
jgi:hypothetical protein